MRKIWVTRHAMLRWEERVGGSGFGVVRAAVRRAEPAPGWVIAAVTSQAMPGTVVLVDWTTRAVLLCDGRPFRTRSTHGQVDLTVVTVLTLDSLGRGAA